ncbi:MAG: hypothetical protein ABSG10_06120 [Terracidiphilus sp.]|jgi:hypothetical protein
MQVDLSRRLIAVFAALALSASLGAQQTSGSFRWIDFHNPKDQNIVAWVTRSLQVEKWTAIREIGVVYDAALVVTADRSGPQSPPSDDTFTIWNVSLTSHVVAPLLSGVNLRWFDWEHFAENAPEELTVLYDSCHDCSASTYFTSFHYDVSHHMWAARWVRGGQGVLVWNAAGPSAPGIAWTQLYAEMAGPDGRAFLVTWNHFEYGKVRGPSDTLFRYDVDPASGLERTVELTRDDADAMELRMCRGQDAVQGLARGQDSALCQQMLNEQPQRKPVTTPPANNRGRSVPPAVRH